MPGTPEGIIFRVGEVERRMGEVEKLPSQVAAMNVKIDGLHEGQMEFKDQVKSLRSALFAFALSVAGSAIVFAFAVLQLTK